jgi:hypothetical protein
MDFLPYDEEDKTIFQRLSQFHGNSWQIGDETDPGEHLYPWFDCEEEDFQDEDFENLRRRGKETNKNDDNSPFKNQTRYLTKLSPGWIKVRRSLNMKKTGRKTATN